MTSPARPSCTPSAASSPSPARSSSVRASAASSSATAADPCCRHDLTIAAFGGLILWFGWYGFNPGSTLSAMDFEGIGRVAANTTLAACAAGLAAMAFVYLRSRRSGTSASPSTASSPDSSPSPVPATGSAPTVRSSSAASPASSWSLGVDLLEWLRIDDPIGAVPVHGFCGIWGTLSLGLFACGKYGATGALAADNSAPLTGLFYGGGFTVLAAQAIGSLIVTVATFSVAFAVMYVVNAMGLLRVSPEGESLGLDIHEHGISAYPEYVISSTGSPSAMHLPAHATITVESRIRAAAPESAS